jgi:hypothetical protein
LNILRVFTNKITSYRDRYSKHPSPDALATILKTELDSEDAVIQQQVKEYFTRVTTNELDNEEYIKEKSLDFCRKQNLKEAMLQLSGATGIFFV